MADVYVLTQTTMTAEDFLDLEELGTCARDRKAAWELWLSKHPDISKGLVPGAD